MRSNQTQQAVPGWDLDEAFEALADSRRRDVLFALRDGDAEAVRDLVSGEADRTALWHLHLPKLADGGYVEWDRETGSLDQGPNFAAVEPLLAAVEERAEGSDPTTDP